MTCEPRQIREYGSFKEILPYWLRGSHHDSWLREYASVCDSDRIRAVGVNSSTAFLFLLQTSYRGYPAFDSEQFVGGFCSARVLGKALASYSLRSDSSLPHSHFQSDLQLEIWGEGGLLERFKEGCSNSSNQTVTESLELDRLCSKCITNEVYLPEIPTMDWCDECIWRFVNDSND